MPNNTDTTEGGRVGQVPLAAHIAAVMNDPATPAPIYNALLDALGELQSDRMKRPTAAFIAAVLAQQQERPSAGASDAPAQQPPDAARNNYEPGGPEAEWRISIGEAEAIAHVLLFEETLSQDEKALRHLLVLLRALTYSRDVVAREGVYFAVKNLALPYLAGVEEALNQVCDTTQAALRSARGAM